MWKIEVTDTFGGEANYCWVKRGETKVQSKRGLREAVKELAGWTGWCYVHTEDYGDMKVFKPSQASGVNQIAFATWSDQ